MAECLAAGRSTVSRGHFDLRAPPLLFITWLLFFQQEIPSFPPEDYSLKWFRASFIAALVIAELFYKFHSFLLETRAFLGRWFVIGAVVHPVVCLVPPPTSTAARPS